MRGRLLLHRENVDRFDHELNFIADFQIEVLEGFGGQNGGHFRGNSDFKFHEGHDFVAGDFGDFGGEVVACSVFHGVLFLIWFLELSPVA